MNAMSNADLEVVGYAFELLGDKLVKEFKASDIGTPHESEIPTVLDGSTSFEDMSYNILDRVVIFLTEKELENVK